MLAKTVSGSDATALPLDKIALDANSPHVGEAAVEEFISEKRIGERIKKLRLQKSMGLAELASHTGLSASFLSQLETGRVVPTLRNLTRISMVFSKDLSYFFEPEPQTETPTPVSGAVLNWDELTPGAKANGPARLESETNSCSVPAGWSVRIDGYGNAILETN